MVAKDDTPTPAVVEDDRDAPAFMVANEDLWVGSQRAHSKGELVPKANVKKHGWESFVSKP